MNFSNETGTCPTYGKSYLRIALAAKHFNDHVDSFFRMISATPVVDKSMGDFLARFLVSGCAPASNKSVIAWWSVTKSLIGLAYWTEIIALVKLTRSPIGFLVLIWVFSERTYSIIVVLQSWQQHKISRSPCVPTLQDFRPIASFKLPNVLANSRNIHIQGTTTIPDLPHNVCRSKAPWVMRVVGSRSWNAEPWSRGFSAGAGAWAHC